MTDKHFSEELMPDWENINYNNPRCNPCFTLRHSATQVRVSMERIFYYVGDTITVQVQVDNADGKLHVGGVELALMRSMEAEGPSEYHEKKVCYIKEQVTLKTHTFDVKCKKTDQNIFKLDFELPSIDEVSWMPSNLSDDQEATLSYFTPTTLGQAVKIRYFILTRLVHKKLPAEQSQRIMNEVRIFTKPMFLFSDTPEGRTPAEDPFEYYGGATWGKIVQTPEMVKMMRAQLTRERGGKSTGSVSKAGARSIAQKRNVT